MISLNCVVAIRESMDTESTPHEPLYWRSQKFLDDDVAMKFGQLSGEMFVCTHLFTAVQIDDASELKISPTLLLLEGAKMSFVRYLLN